MARVAINPDVVEWARNWNSLSTEQLVQKLAVEPDVYKAWIEGGQRPTFKQAQKLAKKLNVPLTYLFLQEPPIIEVPVPDLRTVRNAARGSFSPNFIDVLYDSLRKRDWYRSLLLSQGQEPLDFIGKFQVTDDPRAVAADMRRVLASNSLFDSARSWEDYLLQLIRQAENVGVLILRSGVVGSNTHRPLSVEEFRGFTISDEISPLVFINSRDTKAAQIFTLAHELAHLWVGASGVSNIALRSNAQDLQGLELACNSIAAEFLVPADTLAERAYGKEVTLELAQSLARSFRVSVLVVLRRFYELGQLHRGEFFEFYDQAIAAMPERKKAKGGDAERNLIARNSPRLTQEVISELRGQRLSHSDAAALLGASVAVIAKLSASEGPPSAEVPV